MTVTARVYALHHRYRAGDYETGSTCSASEARMAGKVFEFGAWPAR
jgi:hypothetical protein